MQGRAVSPRPPSRLSLHDRSMTVAALILVPRLRFGLRLVIKLISDSQYDGFLGSPAVPSERQEARDFFASYFRESTLIRSGYFKRGIRKELRNATPPPKCLQRCTANVMKGMAMVRTPIPLHTVIISGKVHAIAVFGHPGFFSGAISMPFAGWGLLSGERRRTIRKLCTTTKLSK